MKKKIITFISIFIIGTAVGLGLGIYADKTLKNLVDSDYICEIETNKWSNCKNGEWVATNMGNKEKISAEGDIIPPKSKLYKGIKEKISTLKYGNTKNGCDGNLLFSSEENEILKLRDSKDHILQKIDMSTKGVVTLKSGIHAEFNPKEISPCIKTESLNSFNKIKKKRKR